MCLLGALKAPASEAGAGAGLDDPADSLMRHPTLRKE